MDVTRITIVLGAVLVMWRGTTGGETLSSVMPLLIVASAFRGKVLPAECSRAVPSLVERWVQSRPDSPAIFDPTCQETTSYAQLWRSSGALAARLRRLGVGRGEVVALSLPRGRSLIVAMLAVARAGVRGRVFRPGLIMSARDTGACNNRDLVWRMLTSGLAVGAHPTDERAEPVSPVDTIARAIVSLALSPSSVGRVYHLADERSVSTRERFDMLGRAGLTTEPLPQWRRRVAERALDGGSEVMSAVALDELEGQKLAEDDLQVRGWQPWLRKQGLSAAITPEQPRQGLVFLAERHEEFAALLPKLAGRRGGDDVNAIEERV
ncbi:AMP-binding protein [Micromonospora sp. DT228]|uniref:AMP-binding protein n=1 Tax=Micromonospora sp. DT228 TaxID=3393443 RepID=UPI003CFB7330